MSFQMHFFLFSKLNVFQVPAAFLLLSCFQLLLKAFPVVESYKFSSLEGHPYLEKCYLWKKGGMEAAGTAARKKYQQISGLETR
jgi:hypothetical protein